MDNTEFTQLEKAIPAKQLEAFDRAYDETLIACYSCHKAVGKPYLRPQRPKSVEVEVINFDRAAKWPQ